MVSTTRAHWHQLVIFLGPALVLYTMFMTWPLLDSLRLSFFDLDLDGSATFVGLDNFSKLFNDPNMTNYDERFFGALANTIHFFVVFMLFQNPTALLLAALVSTKNLRGKAIYRTVLFAPTTLSIVIIGWIWTLMLNPMWGIINDIINGVGMGSIIPSAGWLGSSGFALTVIALVGVWQYVGLPFILFLAALTRIEEELIEAARVDGATGWGIFWRIKFPLILPTAGIVAILTFVGNFSAFDNVYVMQGSQAGPDFSTDILGTFFYRTTFGTFAQMPNYSMGTTIATVMFMIILAGVIFYMFGIQRHLIRD